MAFSNSPWIVQVEQPYTAHYVLYTLMPHKHETEKSSPFYLLIASTNTESFISTLNVRRALLIQKAQSFSSGFAHVSFLSFFFFAYRFYI